MSHKRRALVLAAGQLLTHEVWAPQVADLSGDFDVHFADHMRDSTIADMAARLLSDAPEQFDLVALAMGGFVAFEVLRQARERVRSLVLISTMASPDFASQTERRLGYMRLVEAGRFAEVVEERMAILLHPARREDSRLLAIVRRMANYTGAETFLRQQRAVMARIDSRPSLAAITCPVMVIRGAQDAIATAAHQSEMCAAIPGARFEVIDDCGHLPTLEKPAAVTALLRDWLNAR